MRIRTIKPEFWTNEDLATVSEPGRLLAIGLLNYADDEGYFRANPLLIKAAIFPIIDPSMTIQRLIIELSCVGYIETCKGLDGKDYGRVVNFSEHQVIQRPKSSKIKDLWTVNDESMTDHILVNDPSMQEQGTGNREQGKEQGRKKEEEEKKRWPETGPGTKPKSSPRKASRQPVEDPAMIRLGGLFWKRHPELWPAEDIRRYRDAAPTAEEIDLVAAYYSANIREDSDLRFQRKSLETLLNNWSTEVGKAEQYAAAPHLHDQPKSSRKGNDHTIF